MVIIPYFQIYNKLNNLVWSSHPQVIECCVNWLQMTSRYSAEFGAIMLAWLHHFSSQTTDSIEILERFGISDDEGRIKFIIITGGDRLISISWHKFAFSTFFISIMTLMTHKCLPQ